MRTLLTPAEATRKYGLTPETWRRWERIGWVEAIKTPTGRRLFTEAAIELALRERARRDRQAVRMGKYAQKRRGSQGRSPALPGDLDARGGTVCCAI